MSGERSFPLQSEGIAECRTLVSLIKRIPCSRDSSEELQRWRFLALRATFNSCLLITIIKRKEQSKLKSTNYYLLGLFMEYDTLNMPEVLNAKFRRATRVEEWNSREPLLKEALKSGTVRTFYFKSHSSYCSVLREQEVSRKVLSYLWGIRFIRDFFSRELFLNWLALAFTKEKHWSAVSEVTTNRRFICRTCSSAQLVSSTCTFTCLFPGANSPCCFDLIHPSHRSGSPVLAGSVLTCLFSSKHLL